VAGAGAPAASGRGDHGRGDGCGARRLMRSAVLVACLLVAASAHAQQTPTKPPPLPEGSGRIEGRVIHPDGAAAAAGTPVVLYGLSAQGEPGVADTTADEFGRFRFDGVSTDPQMAYLIGARHRDIPFFGPRVSFAAGEEHIEADIEVVDPVLASPGIRTSETVMQVEWVGGGLAVQELHRIEGDGRNVVFVPESERERVDAPFEARLPEGSSEFVPMASGFDDALTEQDGRVRFWGPVYPGGIDVRFQYLVLDPPSPDSSGRTQIAVPFPSGSGELTVLSSVDGPVISAPGLEQEEEPTELEGRSYRVARRTDVAPGEVVTLEIALPEVHEAVDAVELTRADLWLELDDARVSVRSDVGLRVTGSGLVVGHEGAPLAVLPLPAGARNVVLPPEARALGARLDGAEVAVLGPLPAGESMLRMHYELPATPEGAVLDLRFPREVATLNLLVADTGVEIRSERLHRRRPFRQGTRVFLHREAFNVAPGEEVEVALQPLDRGTVGHGTSLALAIAGVLAAVAFLVQPLRDARRPREPGEAEGSPSALAREAIYQDIRDLDHDFETGKISEDDHAALRAELRQRAVDLLRRERASSPDAAAATRAPEDRASAPSAAQGADTAAARAAFCTACGQRLEHGWKFCSSCGQPVARAGESRAGQAG